MLSAVCDSREKDVVDKGSTCRGTVKRVKGGTVNSWYARKAMICVPSIVTKHLHQYIIIY